MLVFTRKRHEAIVIGDGIEVRVLRVGRDSVRLGVTAPASVSVHRREIYEQIREGNRLAVKVPATSVVNPAKPLCSDSRDPAGSVAADAASQTDPESDR
jgi:carbon storage regulator